ncbi:MAG: hypothetical protein LBM93_02825 [Oscillospiraceae bacterium]|jgi:hypothetical protein|nr:hypothetical protein [Oscillospiraceae bacterium]
MTGADLKINATKVYENLRKSKLLPAGTGERKFVISCAKPKQRQVTVFGYGNSNKKVFDETLALISPKFKNSDVDWIFCGTVISEESMLITDFCKKIKEGFSDWDGISFDGIYNFALLKQDIDNFELVTENGKLNDICLTALFLRKNTIDPDLGFTSAVLKYITVFKISGMSLYNGKLTRYHSDELSEEYTPFSLLPFIISEENAVEIFENKLKLLTKRIKTNQKIMDRINNKEQKIVFLSVCDG